MAGTANASAVAGRLRRWVIHFANTHAPDGPDTYSTCRNRHKGRELRSACLTEPAAAAVAPKKMICRSLKTARSGRSVDGYGEVIKIGKARRTPARFVARRASGPDVTRSRLGVTAATVRPSHLQSRKRRRPWPYPPNRPARRCGPERQGLGPCCRGDGHTVASCDRTGGWCC